MNKQTRTTMKTTPGLKSIRTIIPKKNSVQTFQITCFFYSRPHSFIKTLIPGWCSSFFNSFRSFIQTVNCEFVFIYLNRNSKVKWHYVFNQFIQIIGAIIYVYYIFMRFCIPVFKHFNTEHVSVKMFVLSILSCHLPGTLLLLIIFYGFLHCWLNAFAEMLRFADRMFYKDWWNSTNYSNYYRTVIPFIFIF